MKNTFLNCVQLLLVVIGGLLLSCSYLLGRQLWINHVLEEEERAAPNRLQTALNGISRMPGDIIIQSDSGVYVGGTMGCISYMYEELHGTNDFDSNEVLNFYEISMPKAGWKSTNIFYEGGVGYTKDNFHVSVYTVEQFYEYDLSPFGSKDMYLRKSPPRGATIEELVRQFRTVFALELSTHPPKEVNCTSW